MALQFKAKYPFLEVNINRAEGERIVTRVLQEARAKKTLVDVIQTPAFYLHALRKRGIIRRILSPQTTASYPRISKKRNLDDDLLQSLCSSLQHEAHRCPKSSQRYDDLLSPFWKNKMILEKDKIDWFTAMLHILGREKGIKYMRELSRQTPMLRIGQELITQLVAAGEASLQVNSNAVTVNRLKQKGAPIDWVAPGPLPGLMVGVGLTAQAPHPAAARLLVRLYYPKRGSSSTKAPDDWSPDRICLKMRV